MIDNETIRFAIATSLARDSMGVYPAATVMDKVTVERTEFQNGYNQYGSDLLARAFTFDCFLSNLSDKMLEDVMFLVDKDVLILRVREGQKDIKPRLLVSDTFGYSCMETEPITFDEIPAINELYGHFEECGVVAYVARRRNQNPISPRRTKAYFAALKYMTRNRIRVLEYDAEGRPILPCPKGDNHVWGIDGAHSNVFCKKCYCDVPKSVQLIEEGDISNGSE